MIINTINKTMQIRSDMPSKNWLADTDNTWALLDESTKRGIDLMKIFLQNTPFVDLIVNDEQQVIDIIPTERPKEALEVVQSAKLAELSTACSQDIIAGCDVELSAASGHISLTAEDQINLTAALNAVKQGAAGYPYHLDGQLCAVFLAADIRLLAQAAASHKLYHTTYYNHLAAWVRRSETAEEVQAITYGTELPEDLAANMANILGGVETENEEL